jgi:hypothetical protein
VYKDKTVVNAFAINPVAPNLVAVASGTGLKEFDLTNYERTLSRDVAEYGKIWIFLFRSLR